MTTEGGALEAILLAAGAGRRFGGGKLMSAWRGGRLIDGALAAALAAPVRRVVVVAGADPRVADAAQVFAAARGETARLAIVHAADHQQGLSASLRAGLDALADDVRGAFVFLGDMPLIPRDVPARLAHALVGNILAAAPICDRRRGHPVLFAPALFPRLAELGGDRGAYAIVDGLGERLSLIETEDPGVLFDIDRPADLGVQSPTMGLALG